MPAYQPDLFPLSPLVPGLRFAENFIGPDEEAALAACIDAAGLAPFRFQGWEGKWLTASFGHDYDFDCGRLGAAPPIPEWLLPLRERVAQFAGEELDAFVQTLVIRYDPGAGIGWHRDRPQFGMVAGVSLGADVTLRLRRRTSTGFERKALPLPPRSLYLLAGEARHGWEHSIASHPATRWSITFRTLVGPEPARAG